jgi:acyl-CoA synthetase (AMP-forming)/AMP-acid ligase II
MMIAGAMAGCEMCVINRHYGPAEVAGLLQRFDFQHIVSDADLAIEGVTAYRLADVAQESAGLHPLQELARDPRVLVLTTGTTGAPKGAQYLWSSLSAQARVRDDLVGTRWLLAYYLNHFAGIQMLTHTLANRATMVIPASSEVDAARQAMVDFEVEFASSTPRFWRFLLAQLGRDRARALPVRQITLGGEAVPADLLALLHDHFPSAKISQIFATTEIGSCFSVKDMSNGLPVSLLEKPSETGAQIKIVDDELHILSTHGMLSYYGEPETTGPVWRATGDLVEIRADRIFFVGRKSGTINVGGVKVHTLPVEELVQRVPGVAAVLCYGRKNPVTGQIVAVDVVPATGADREKLEGDVRRACEALSRHAQPRVIRIVDALDMANGKVLRRAT